MKMHHLLTNEGHGKVNMYSCLAGFLEPGESLEVSWSNMQLNK